MFLCSPLLGLGGGWDRKGKVPPKAHAVGPLVAPGILKSSDSEQG